MFRQYAIPDGSCFLHSVSESTNPEYRSLETNSKKTNYVKNIRENLSKYYNNIEKYSEISNGSEYLIHVLELLIPNLEIIQNKNLNTKASKIKFKDEIFLAKTFNSIKLIDLTNLNDLVRTSDFYINGKFSLENFRNKYVRLYTDIIKSKITDIDVDDLKRFLLLILKQAEDKALEKFTKDLADVGCYFEQYLFGILTDFFNVDVYILKDSNGQIFPSRQGCETIKNRTSVVVVNVGEAHYETVFGVDLKTKKAIYAFPPDHPFIKKLNKIVCGDLSELKNDEFKLFYDFYTSYRYV